MEKRNDNIYLKILVNFIVYIAGLLIIILILPELIQFFLPFIIAWVIAWIANPLVQFLEKRVRIVRKHSSVLIILLVIAAVALALYGLVRFVSAQVSILVEELPDIIYTISSTLDQVGLVLSQTLSDLPLSIQEPIYQFGESLSVSFNSFIADARLPEATIGITRNIGDYLFFILVMFISAYFFIKDRVFLIKKLKNITPKSVLEKYELIKYHFNYAVIGYFKAQFKIMGVVTIILYIGFKIIGAPYAFLIALITGFVDLLPVFGTGFILWPWALVEIILGHYFNGIFLFGLYLGCQLIKNILQPKLVGDSVGLNPLLTLVLMYIGYQLAGFLGLIFAIPTGIILINLYRIGMFDNIIYGLKILVKDVNAFRKF